MRGNLPLDIRLFMADISVRKGSLMRILPVVYTLQAAVWCLFNTES